MTNQESVLFIGGGGFIGSNLVRRFVNSGRYKVYIFEAPGAPTERIEDLLDDVQVINGQLGDTSFFNFIICS